MEALCLSELEPLCSRVWQDDARNVIGLIEGRGEAPPVRIMAHKDELGCLVARIDDDGKIRLEPLGGAYAWVYGEGPMDLLGSDIVTGVFAVGSKHVSDLSADVAAARSTKPLSWDVCRLDCKLDAKALAEKGITVGTRACVSRSRKKPVWMGDYVGGYAMDDKASVAAVLLAAEALRDAGLKPRGDVYLCITSTEEVGCAGGAYAARTLPGDMIIAVDIAPVAPEYPVEPGPNPVVLYKDGAFVYNKALSDELCAAAEQLGLAPQRMAVRNYGSDSSYAAKSGLAGRVAALCPAVENTHGYEVTHADGLVNCARVLAAWLTGEAKAFGVGE